MPSALCSYHRMAAAVALVLLMPFCAGAVRDAGATAILFPQGLIRWRGQSLQVRAQAIVSNFGDSTVSFPTELRIDNQLVGTTLVEDLAPQTSDTVEFAITLPESASHSIACSTALAGDDSPGNDRAADSFQVRHRALAILWQTRPDTVGVGDSLPFHIYVANLGPLTEEFPLLLTIARVAGGQVVYTNTRGVSLNPGAAQMLQVGMWVPVDTGLHECLLRIDTLPLVDTLSRLVMVLSAAIKERSGVAKCRQSLEVGPNPFRGRIVFRLALSASPRPQGLDIFDAFGRLVRRFRLGADRPRLVTWNGTDEQGRALPAGVYLARLTSDRESVSEQVLLLR